MLTPTLSFACVRALCFLCSPQPDQIPGDVVVVLQQQEHALFKRDGANLFHKRTITLLEALTGFSFPLYHLDGRTLVVKSDPAAVVKPGAVLALREEGMPQKGNPYVRGNIYIEFDVAFPEGRAITEATKKVLRTVLPAPAPQSNGTGGGDAAMSDAAAPEEVTLITVDFEAEKRKFAAQEREAYEAEEEEDDGRHGHGQPQCRQQ